MDILVDPEDCSLVERYTWWLSSNGYVCTDVGGRANQKRLYLHRLILDAGPEEQVDHRNRNRLDNRRMNLRLATHVQNNFNRRACREYAGRPTNSRFKGVFLHRQSGRWNARIGFEGRSRSLGYFDDEIEAAKAYDEAARELHGEFACPNFSEL